MRWPNEPTRKIIQPMMESCIVGDTEVIAVEGRRKFWHANLEPVQNIENTSRKGEEVMRGPNKPRRKIIQPVWHLAKVQSVLAP
jgi:hypothetical protein